MNTTELPGADPKELARLVLVAAAHFAGAAMEAYSKAHPEQVELMVHAGGSFGVRVSDILTTEPRVVLENVVGDKAVEIAHVQLHRPAPPDPSRMN